MLDDALHLLVHEFNAPEARLLQPADLPFDEQLKGHLGDKEGGTGSGGIPDRREDVQGAQTTEGVNLTQGRVEDLVKDVADAGATAQLSGLNVLGHTVDGAAVGGVEFCDDLQQQLALQEEGTSNTQRKIFFYKHWSLLFIIWTFNIYQKVSKTSIKGCSRNS